MISASFIASVSLAIACAILSVFVISRRWAFIGEGIGHAGFGGAGTAWLLSLAFPAMKNPGATYAVAVLFCIIMAIGIAYFSRRKIHVDTVIGIFLVASIAWGLAAQGIYAKVNHDQPPSNWEDFLVGRLGGVSFAFGAAAVAAALAAIVIVTLLWKEIVSYCFDPAMAEVAGVRTGVIHYLLILLLALMIILGLELTGPLLIPALLILPGAAALQLSKRMKSVFAISVAIAILGSVIGSLAHACWQFIPAGPAIVLVMFAMFLISYAIHALGLLRA